MSAASESWPLVIVGRAWLDRTPWQVVRMIFGCRRLVALGSATTFADYLRRFGGGSAPGW